MQTREELLNKLGEAVNIIRQLANIQQRLNNTRAQYRNTMPFRQPKKVTALKVFVAIWVALIILVPFSIFVSDGCALLSFAVVPFIFYRNKKKNKKIEEQNTITQQQNNQILANNEQLKLQEQNVLNELQQLQNIYRERISPWYPVDYCSVEAVEFLYNAINNYRADSLKEAINLYETTLHQQRVESNQKQALRQQTLSNLLSAGSLVMQGATLGAINNQTAAINNQTASVNNVNDTLNRIRRGY
ncbi:MAG: hypothetical protein IJ958_04280 [Agathobacter sp.]|nr:hypothetical protein [Agathobacter sp.]